MQQTHRTTGSGRSRAQQWVLAVLLGAAGFYGAARIPWAERVRQLRGPFPPDGVVVEARPDGPPLLRVDPVSLRRLGLHTCKVTPGSGEAGPPLQALVRVEGRRWVYVELQPGLFRRMEWPRQIRGQGPGWAHPAGAGVAVVDRPPSQLLAWELARSALTPTPAPF